MAHVSNRPRCSRCKEFRPTQSTQTGRGVVQLCAACALRLAYGNAEMPNVADVQCPRCRGRGELVLDQSTIMCRDCDGKGSMKRAQRILTCTVCGGVGVKVGCSACNNTGLASVQSPRIAMTPLGVEHDFTELGYVQQLGTY